MPLLSIDQVRALPEPQRDYNFDVQFPPVGAASAPVVEQITSPFFNVSAEPYLINYHYHNVPGMRQGGTFSVVFYEDRLGTAESYWNAWLNLIYNPDGTINLPANYKKIVIIQRVDELNTIIATKTLYGVFPNTAVDPHYATGKNGRIVMEAQFVFDDMLNEMTATSVVMQGTN